MNWFKAKESPSQVEVKCSHCGQIQIVSEKVSAVFCIKCKKTIFTKIAKAAKPKGTVPPPTKEPKEPTKEPEKEVEKEVEKPKPEVPGTAHNIGSKAASGAPLTGPFPTASSMSSTTKKIRCSNCKTTQTVPSIALASFCEKCGQRINLQDYKIKGHFHGELETRGKICIAEGAIVKANLNVGSAVIEGRINGKIVAETRVELIPGCLVEGSIHSPTLIVHEGAGFVGKGFIGATED